MRDASSEEASRAARSARARGNACAVAVDRDGFAKHDAAVAALHAWQLRGERGGGGVAPLARVRTFDLFRARGDLNVGRQLNNVTDCTHYCYAPLLFEPVWERIVDALTAA